MKKKQNVTDQKEEVINVRLTKEQKKMLKEAAASEGMGLSTWLLRLGLVERDRKARQTEEARR